MKFGILTQWYEPEPGPAALPAGLARGLAVRGHDVRVVTGFPNYPTGKIAAGYKQQRRMDETLGGVEVRRVALYANHDDSAARRVLNYASFAASATVSGLDAFAGLDALWVNYSPVTIGVPMLHQIRRHGTPTVVHALDLWPDTMTASKLGGPGAGRVESLLHRWCGRLYEAAERVAYISPGVGDVLAARGVPHDKLAYAPMWADEAVYQPLESPVHRDFGLKTEDVALVYAGSLGGAQGLDSLIEACARLSDTRLKCLIAGSGTHEQQLRDLAATAGADNLRFLGRLSAQEVANLSANADVQYVGLNDHPLAAITMPSKIQAILAGARPIVGSLVGDAADVVARSGGWTVAPGDIDGLSQQLREITQLGREGLLARRTQARALYETEFSYDRGVECIESLLMEAARRGSRG